MRVSPFSLRLTSPFETAAGAVDRREGLLVRVDGEPAGLGEATPLAGWTEPFVDCLAALEDLDDREPVRSTGDLPDMAATPAARHGIELALLDRGARRSGVPLYRQLGGARRVVSVPANATVGDDEPRETVDACLEAAGRGYRTIKIKVGARPMAADLERLARVRERLDPSIELRVDANAAWDETEAGAAVDELARLGIAVVEQPLPPADLDGHAALRGRGVDVAVDESVREHGVEAVVEAKAADVVVVKPMVLGGVARSVTAAERARAAGLDVIVTTTVDAVVARTAAVHLAAALDVDRACGLATASMLAGDLADDPAAVVDGAVTVPQSAGHGVSVGDLV